jgi:hypothetical protein
LTHDNGAQTQKMAEEQKQVVKYSMAITEHCTPLISTTKNLKNNKKKKKDNMLIFTKKQHA